MSEQPTELEVAIQTAEQLNTENAALRDELGRYRAAVEETEEERRHRWGSEILAAIDASGGRRGAI